MILRPSRFAYLPYLGAFFVSVFLAADVELRAATITAASVSLVDVSAAVASAVDGDTVIVPSGTATWTSRLVIANAITLIGQTTTDSVTGTAVDNTIIVSKLVAPNLTPLIGLDTSSGKTYRISGFTFQDAQTVSTGQYHTCITGQSNSIRLDHCHYVLTNNWLSCVRLTGGVYGVADHDVVSVEGGCQPYHFDNGKAGSTENFGNAAWASPTNWGGSNFFFVEDNYISISGTNVRGATDSTVAGRFVLRHNQFVNAAASGAHGTEGSSIRGQRAMEVYDNIFSNTISSGSPGSTRGGNVLLYNNTLTGNTLNSTTFSLDVFREFFSFPGGTWLAGNGTSPWDINETEGEATNVIGTGAWVSGHSPHLYYSGTCKNPAGTTTLQNTQLIDSQSPNWGTDQWKNFQVKRVSDGKTSYITGNNSNTLNVYPNASVTGDTSATYWQPGDSYQIYRVLVALDQSGRGRGDLVSGSTAINTVTGTASWPHQVLDPCYSWSNRQGTTHVDFGADIDNATCLVNRDFYNEATAVSGVQTTGVGVGTLTDRPARGVAGTDITGVTTNPPGTAYWATDVPSINGSTDNGALYVWSGGAWELYYQPYTYPHPLVSGVLSAPTNLRVVN